MMSIIFVSRMSSRRWADWAEIKAALMAFFPDDSPFLFAGAAAPAAAVPFDAAAVVRLKKHFNCDDLAFFVQKGKLIWRQLNVPFCAILYCG